MASFRPLQDRVLIKVLDPETVTDGGIFIPIRAQEKPCEAVVVAAGPGRMTKKKFEPTTVKPGDIVLYGRNMGTEVKIDDVEHIVIREEHLFGILKKA